MESMDSSPTNLLTKEGKCHLLMTEVPSKAPQPDAHDSTESAAESDDELFWDTIEIVKRWKAVEKDLRNPVDEDASRNLAVEDVMEPYLLDGSLARYGMDVELGLGHKCNSGWYRCEIDEEAGVARTYRVTPSVYYRARVSSFFKLPTKIVNVFKYDGEEETVMARTYRITRRYFSKLPTNMKVMFKYDVVAHSDHTTCSANARAADRYFWMFMMMVWIILTVILYKLFH